MLHDTARFNMSDRFFVSGGNPDGNGGGVIGTAKEYSEAVALRDRAVKEGYLAPITIRTYEELNNEK